MDTLVIRDLRALHNKAIDSRPFRNGRQRYAERPLSPVDVFKARAEARAALFAAGEFDLHEAVDGLQAAAVASGLIDAIGQNAVQAILAEAFGKARRHA